MLNIKQKYIKIIFSRKMAILFCLFVCLFFNQSVSDPIKQTGERTSLGENRQVGQNFMF